MRGRRWRELWVDGDVVVGQVWSAVSALWQAIPQQSTGGEQ